MTKGFIVEIIVHDFHKNKYYSDEYTVFASSEYKARQLAVILANQDFPIWTGEVFVNYCYEIKI